MVECERKTDSAKTSYVSPSFPEESGRLSQSETSPTENNAAVSFEKKSSQKPETLGESMQHANPYFGTRAKIWDVDENHGAVSESSHSTQPRKESAVDSTIWGNKAVEQQDAATSGDSQSLSLEEVIQLAAEAALSAPSSGIQASYSGSRSGPSDRAGLETPTLDDCSSTVVDTLRSYDLTNVDKAEKGTTIETAPDCAKSEGLNLSNDTESTQLAKASARENREEIQGELENEGDIAASGRCSTELANEQFLGMPPTPFDAGIRSNTPFMSPSAPLQDATRRQGSSIAHLTSQDLGDSPLLARVSSSLHGDDSSEIIEMGPPAIISDDLGQEYLVQPVRRSIGNDPRLVGHGQEMHYGNVEPGSGMFDSSRGENSHETVAHQSPRAPRMSDDGVFGSLEGFTSRRSSTNLERGTIHESIEPMSSGNAMLSLMTGTPRAKGQRLTAAAALQTSSEAALPRSPLEYFHSKARSNGHGSPAAAVEPVIAGARETDHESERQQPMIGRTRFGQPRLHFEEGKGKARTPSMSTDLGFYAGGSASTDGINVSGELVNRPQSAGAFETVSYGHRATPTSIDVRQLYLDGVLRYCSEFGHHASGRNVWNTSRASRMSIPIEVEFRERLLQRRQTDQPPSVPSSNMNEAPTSSTEFKSSSLSSHEDRLFYYYHNSPHRRSISDDMPRATPSLDLSARMSEMDIKDVLQAENNRLLDAPSQRGMRTENGMMQKDHDANEIFSPFSMMKGRLSDSSPSVSHASEGNHCSQTGGCPDGDRQDDRTDERRIKDRFNIINARLPSSASSSRAWGSSPEPPPSRERSLEESLRHSRAEDNSAGADGRASNGNTSMSREKIDGSLSSLESSESADLVDEWEIKRDEIVLGPRIGIGSFGALLDYGCELSRLRWPICKHTIELFPSNPPKKKMSALQGWF